MHSHSFAVRTAIGITLSALTLAGCSSTDQASTEARQAAAATPKSGAAICLKNDTNSNFGGTSENTREVDRDLYIPSGETGCAWWVGASKPKLILQGSVGANFEVVRSGNFDITFCGEELDIPWGTDNGSSEEITVDCEGNPLAVTFVKSTEAGRTLYTAVVRDAS